MKGGSDFDAIVGSRVRALRLSQHKTLTDLGDAIGVSFPQVQKYENGSNRISAGRLQRIADALHTHPAFFFEGQKPSRPKRLYDDEIGMFAASDECAGLARAFSRIKSKIVRKRIVEFVEACSAAEENCDDTSTLTRIYLNYR